MVKFYDFTSVIVQGISGTGKTSLMKEIIRQKDLLFFTIPTKIIYIYSHYQEIYDEMKSYFPDISFVKNIPDEKELTHMVSGSAHTMLVCDDKMTQVGKEPIILDLFVRLCHHLKISVFLLLQLSNLSKSPYMGEIMRNSHYYFIFKSGQNGQTLRSLGIRINDYKTLFEAYKLAVKGKNHAYICINLHPNAQEIEKYSTNILPSDGYTILYIRQKSLY